MAIRVTKITKRKVHRGKNARTRRIARRKK